MSVIRITPAGPRPAGDTLNAVLEGLASQRAVLSRIPVARLLALLDDFAGRLLGDQRTQRLEGIAFLSAWLRRRNLEQLLELNLGGHLDYLDGFVPRGPDYLAARPHGLVAMWLAGNVPTLPLFSLVPALLAKNVCLAKLASAEPNGMDRLLAVLAESQAEGLRGTDLLEAAAVVWFDYRDRSLNEQMSLAADAKVLWGGTEAIQALTALRRREHCVEIVFGPKYSLGLIGRAQCEGGADELDGVVAAFVRDVAAFDQRGCSAPQTIFIERNDRCSLQAVGELFARHLARLPAKPGLDPFTTVRILNARAAWALDPSRDVMASPGDANWTVLMDREASLKEAVQSRTVFLTEVGSWRDILPLLSPKVQTIGLALGDREQSRAFADAATAAGVARCVRPGIMNHYESPWDGKLLVNQLVRWVTWKP